MAELTGIVLAGGRSRRMGEDKASLMLDGVSLLQRCVDRLASVADELVLVGAPGRALPSVAPPSSQAPPGSPHARFPISRRR